MSVTLTTSWQTIKTAQTSYTYDGLSYTWTIAVQARYSNQSGNSATVRLRAIITNNGAYQWYGSNKGYNINGNGYVQYAAAVNGGANFTTNEYTAGSLNGGSSMSVWGTWSVMGTYNATASETVVMPQFEVAPSKPSISVIRDNAHQITITWGLSSFGVPSSGTVYLLLRPYNGSPQTLTYKTTTGQWTYTKGNLTALTRYEVWASATNGSKTTESAHLVIDTGNALYAPSSNNKTKLAQGVYVPFNGLSRKVIKMYRGDSNNEAERIY